MTDFGWNRCLQKLFSIVQKESPMKETYYVVIPKTVLTAQLEQIWTKWAGKGRIQTWKCLFTIAVLLTSVIIPING